RGEQFHQGGQDRVERLIGGLVAVPESALAAADVPVAQLVIDERLRLQAEAHHVVALETLARLADEQLEVGKNPTVHVRPLAPRDRRGSRVEAASLWRDAGQVAEEGVTVPQLQEELASQLLRWTRTEVDVQRRVLSAVEPAHLVGPHRRILRQDHAHWPVLD